MSSQCYSTINLSDPIKAEDALKKCTGGTVDLVYGGGVTEETVSKIAEMIIGSGKELTIRLSTQGTVKSSEWYASCGIGIRMLYQAANIQSLSIRDKTLVPKVFEAVFGLELNKPITGDGNSQDYTNASDYERRNRAFADKTLTVLDFSHVRLGSRCIQALNDRLPTLQEFVLKNCCISNVVKWVGLLLQARQLKRISLLEMTEISATLSDHPLPTLPSELCLEKVDISFQANVKIADLVKLCAQTLRYGVEVRILSNLPVSEKRPYELSRISNSNGTVPKRFLVSKYALTIQGNFLAKREDLICILDQLPQEVDKFYFSDMDLQDQGLKNFLEWARSNNRAVRTLYLENCSFDPLPTLPSELCLEKVDISFGSVTSFL